jgi:hypothetical protein
VLPSNSIAVSKLSNPSRCAAARTPQRSGDLQVPPFRLGPSIRVVNQQAVCLERNRQSDGGPLAGIERVQACIWRRIRRDVEPGRRIIDPCANFRRGLRFLHFGRNRFRHHHSVVKRLEYAHGSNRDQVIEWAGIGNDDYADGLDVLLRLARSCSKSSGV